MKLNSQQALEASRRLYESHGHDWARVRESGRIMSDGVIDLADAPSREAPRESAQNGQAGERIRHR